MPRCDPGCPLRAGRLTGVLWTGLTGTWFFAPTERKAGKSGACSTPSASTDTQRAPGGWRHPGPLQPFVQALPHPSLALLWHAGKSSVPRAVVASTELPNCWSSRSWNCLLRAFPILFCYGQGELFIHKVLWGVSHLDGQLWVLAVPCSEPRAALSRFWAELWMWPRSLCYSNDPSGL